jgi:hypothetical protein
MKKLLLAIVLLGVSCTPSVSLAATMHAGETYVLPAGETVTDNLYVAGGDISLLGVAEKDVLVAGGNIIVGGLVGGDLLIAGGTIDVLDGVAGDVRIGGGEITIAGPIGGDLFVAGGVVTIADGASVAGDVLAAGGTVQMNGGVLGNTRVYGGDVIVNAPLAGAVEIKADKTVVFGEHAVVAQAFSYEAPRQAIIQDGAALSAETTFVKSGAYERTTDPALAAGFLALIGFFAVLKFVASVVAVLLVTLVFKRFSSAVVSSVFTSFPKHAGVGFLAFVAVPVASVLLALSLIGFVPAVVLALLYVLFLIVADVFAGIIAGGALSLWFKKEVSANWKWALLGTIALDVVDTLPVLGWIVSFVFFLAALGAITSMLFGSLKK